MNWTTVADGWGSGRGSEVGNRVMDGDEGHLDGNWTESDFGPNTHGERTNWWVYELGDL